MTEHGVLEKVSLRVSIFVLMITEFAPRQTYSASKCFVAFAAHEGSRNKVWIMVAFEVHIQKLFLSERLLTLAAGKRFLSCVCSLVHHHVALLEAKYNSRLVVFGV